MSGGYETCFDFEAGRCSRGDACRYSHDGGASAGRSMACYECGEPGHFGRDCPVRLRNGGRRGPQRRDAGLGGYSTGYYNRGYGGDRSPSRSRSRSRRRRSRRRRDDSDDSGRGRSRRRRGGSRRRRDDSRSASRSDRSASGASSRSGRSGGDVAGEREDEVPCVPCENAAEKKEDPVEELRAS